jgi:hypothetical protein
MVQLAGNFNLTEDPSVEYGLLQNLGNNIEKVAASYKIAQKEKIQKVADAEFVRTLNDARQRNLTPEQTLTEIYNVPNYAKSRLAQEYAKTQELYTQQNDLRNLQSKHLLELQNVKNQNQQTIEELKAENRYNELNAKYQWLLDSKLLTDEQSAKYAQELEKLRQGGRIDLAGINNISRENIAGQNITSHEKIATGNNQAAMDRLKAKPNTSGSSPEEKAYSAALTNMNKTLDPLTNEVKPGMEEDYALWKMKAKVLREKMQTQTVQPPVIEPNNQPSTDLWQPEIQLNGGTTTDTQAVQPQNTPQPQKDQYGYFVGQKIPKNGVVYTYIGNNKWSY